MTHLLNRAAEAALLGLLVVVVMLGAGNALRPEPEVPEPTDEPIVCVGCGPEFWR